MNNTRLNTRGGESNYSAPAIDIIDVRTEQGFAATDIVDYGPEGDAGNNPGHIDGGNY